MTDSRNKRKYAGPTVAELRKIGVGKEVPTVKKPPHQRERRWLLTVEWTETRTYKHTEKYTSKAARDEAKRRLAREIARKLDRPSPKYFGFGTWGSDDYKYLQGFHRIDAISRIDGKPVYTESTEEE